LIVSNGAVTAVATQLPLVNLIWFANEKCLSCQH